MISKLFCSLYLLCAVCFWQGTVAAQEVRFRKLSIDDGLSQNTVRAILQDRRGFMWFGTKDGLNRYDGFDFTVFRRNPYDQTSLSGADITHLYEDAHGGIWVVVRSGELCYYQPERNQFTRVPLGRQSQVPDGSFAITALTGVGGHTLWLGSEGQGLCRLRYHRDSLPQARVQYYTHDPADDRTLKSNTVSELKVDSRGQLWVGTDQGLSVFREQEGRFHHTVFEVRHPDAPSLKSDYQINAIHEDPNGAFWLGTPSGLVKYDRSTGTHILYPHRYARFRYGWGAILRIAEDEEGHFWLATPAGLMHFAPLTGIYTYYTHDPEDPHSLSYNGIASLYVDRTGIVWAGTAGQGLNLYDPRAGRFGILRPKTLPGSRISGFSVGAILEDITGGLWISAGVLYKWGRASDRPHSYEAASDFPDVFGNTELTSMIQDAEGMLWAAGVRGLFKYDPLTGRSTHYRYDSQHPGGIPEFELQAVLEDRARTLWVAGRHTLSRMVDRERGEFETFRYESEASAHRRQQTSLFEDRQGHLWLGTMSGLYRFDPEQGRFEHLSHDSAMPNSLSSNHIKCIAEDPVTPGRYLWIGTTDGLNKLDLADMTFQHYTARNGLPNEVIYGILPDEKGYLWLSSNRGLSRFDPDSEIFRNFDVKDGLQSNEFNTGAFHRGPSGTLYFGGIKGLNYFLPNTITDNPIPPRMAITGFTALDRSFLPTEPITLSHRDNVFTIAFAALDYSAPEKNKYAYRLDGFNQDWIYAGHHRSATYTNLPPGQYTFRVKGTNKDGVWNEEGISLRLRILPPWWRTWWAYGSYIAIFILALIGIRRYELRRFQLRNELKLERMQTETLRNLDELKSRFFANISHEFRTPLTLIQGQLESVHAGENDPGKRAKLQSASRNAHRLLALINQLLELARFDAGKMDLDLQSHDIITFLKTLLNSFETRAQTLSIALHFHAKEEAIPALFDIDKMEKVFVNLIANALKFSEPGGSIYISAGLYDAQTVEIRVKDEGIGIPADQLPFIFDRFYQADGSDTRKHDGVGIGLAIVYEYIKLHGGTINVSSSGTQEKETVAAGTEFVIQFPSGTAGSLPGDGAVPASDIATGTLSGATNIRKAGKSIILIVEDNPEVLAFIRKQLEGLYLVISAGNGKEGIAASMEYIPDLIITDLMMPEMDGYAFSRHLKNDERTSHIPIIMLTAKAGLEDKIEGLEIGIDAYMTKPFSVRELIVRVKTLIHERKKLRSRFASATIIKPSEVSVIPADQAFLEKALSMVENRLDDEQFRVDTLAEAMNMSASQLNRKLNALVGQSGNKFIQSIRLQRAADLLRKQAGTVAAIAYQVGFTDQAYFARVFKKQFGLSPTAYASTRPE